MPTMSGVSPDKIQRNLRELSHFLDNDVTNIQKLFSLYNPLELLKMACWEQRRIDHVRLDDEWSHLVAGRLVSYLQQLVCSSDGTFSQNREIKGKDWKRLGQLFEDFCAKTLRYIDNHVLSLNMGNFFSDESLMVAFQQFADDFCIPPCVDASLYKKKSAALSYRLQPFNELISLVFPCGLDSLIKAFVALGENAFDGIDKLKEDSTVFKQASMLQIELLKSNGEGEQDVKAMMDKVIKQQGWEPWIADIVGRRDGFDLFDVQKVTSLSFEVCALLSNRPGEDETFLSGDSIGWLTKDFGLGGKPFLQIGSKFYCFDAEYLLDKTYRIIRSSVCNFSSELSARWSSIEKEKESLLPVSFFSTLLGTMNFTCNVKMGNRVIDAVFEDDKRKLNLLVLSEQFPTSSGNPFLSSQETILELEHESELSLFGKELADPCIILDMKHDCIYPLGVP